MKDIRGFFQFLEVKISIYLNRRVFVMRKCCVPAYFPSGDKLYPGYRNDVFYSDNISLAKTNQRVN